MINSNFFKLFLASAASNLGDGIALIAFPWFASLLTRDPFLIALVPLFGRAPWLLFSLPAGVIIDRVDRRRLIFMTDIARAALTLLVCGVVLASVNEVGADLVAAEHSIAALGVLYTCALLIGIAEVLRDNAAQTILPSVVPSVQLENANSKLATVELVMNSLCGPPLAGFLIALSLGLAFAVNAGVLFLAALLVFLIAGQYRTTKADDYVPVHWIVDLKEGLGWLFGHTLLRDLAFLLGLTNGAYMMSLATQVLFAQEILGLDAAGFGLLLTGAAFGGVIGGLAAPHLAKNFRSATLLRVSLLLFATESIIFGLTSHPIIAWFTLFLGSAAGIVWNVITVTLRQTIIPDRLMGRVNSVYRFFGWGMMPVGTFVGGVLVSVAQLSIGREWALRIPHLLAGALMLGGLVVLFYRLTHQKIDAARAHAKA
ncbi:MFS transporter [Maritalea porphyrae]|uniref:MFS transporter n=1 Tax=Maritalea porphyrae TaxID=880732 RepID=UPI0022B00C89|nr:MFS transporter [Maritalea porphyrae]MCZ4273540.1 MFS transporter [Maritalea porphyrae]